MSNPKKTFGLSIPENMDDLVDQKVMAHAELCGAGCGSTEYVFATAKQREAVRAAILKAATEALHPDNCFVDFEEDGQ